MFGLKSARSKRRWYLLGLLLLADISVWFWLWQEDRAGVLTVAVLDIGQGDSIFITAPNGNQVLIDGGLGAAVLRQLGQVMPLYDRSIDLVIATHPDADHIGGLVDVLKHFTVSGFMEPGVSAKSVVYETLKHKVAEQQLIPIIARRGMKVVLDNNIYLDILYPDQDVGSFVDKTNDASIVAKLVYGQESFMLTGDAPIGVEQHLIALDGNKLESDVLKVGHHGSRSSTGTEFLKAVKPQLAAISVGAENRYGHPTQEVLDRLAASKTEIYRTDTQGRITFSTNGTSLKIKTIKP
jgi:competence protein ComEC